MAAACPCKDVCWQSSTSTAVELSLVLNLGAFNCPTACLNNKPPRTGRQRRAAPNAVRPGPQHTSVASPPNHSFSQRHQSVSRCSYCTYCTYSKHLTSSSSEADVRSAATSGHVIKTRHKRRWHTHTGSTANGNCVVVEVPPVLCKHS